MMSSQVRVSPSPSPVDAAMSLRRLMAGSVGGGTRSNALNANLLAVGPRMFRSFAGYDNRNDIIRVDESRRDS